MVQVRKTLEHLSVEVAIATKTRKNIRKMLGTLWIRIRWLNNLVSGPFELHL